MAKLSDIMEAVKVTRNDVRWVQHDRVSFTVTDSGVSLAKFGNDGEGWDGDGWAKEVKDTVLESYSKDAMQCFTKEERGLRCADDGIYWDKKELVTFDMTVEGGVCMEVALNSVVDIDVELY